jgi:hypothetical protein
MSETCQNLIHTAFNATPCCVLIIALPALAVNALCLFPAVAVAVVIRTLLARVRS